MNKQLNLLIFGPQGAGKGTQAILIAQKFGIPTISVGAMYREAMAKKTPVGKTAERYINKGMLVPSSITNALVKERLQKKDLKKGVILDGYPRNLVQARALNKYFSLAAVIWINISDEESKRRLLNRLVCEGCELNYNLVYNPSKLKEACEECRGKLKKRADDTPKGIKKRLKIYHTETKPLFNLYKKRGLVIPIDGEGSIDTVNKRIVDKLSDFLETRYKRLETRGQSSKK